MIRRLPQLLYDLNLSSRIQGGPEDHLLEEIGGDPARAGEGGQDPTGAQQLHGQQVDVLVAARCCFDMALSLGELGRVEDNEIEALPSVSAIPQESEHVTRDLLRLDVGVEVVEREVPFCKLWYELSTLVT